MAAPRLTTSASRFVSDTISVALLGASLIAWRASNAPTGRRPGSLVTLIGRSRVPGEQLPGL